MSSVWPTTWPGRPWLRRQVNRLRGSLDTLLHRLREDLSQTIARAVSETVRDAVRQLAGEANPGPRISAPHTPSCVSSRSPGNRHWNAPLDPWGDEDHEPWDDEERDCREPDERAIADVPETEPLPTRRPRWPAAVAAGCRAAAWWLGSSRRYPILGSTAVAVVAALSTALVGPALVTGAAGLFLGLSGLIMSLANATAALNS